MALNAPRTVDYEFRTFVDSDGFTWLFDASARTYLCSSTPNVFAECVDFDGDPDTLGDYWPDPDYFPVSRNCPDGIPGSDHVLSLPFDVPEADAWDDAREAVR